MFLKDVTESEVNAIVSNYKYKKSTCSDNIDMSIIKKVIPHIVKPHICNNSFKNCVFPDRMKIAKVIPLFKSNDNHFFTNYIPISLLLQFSKILEKLYNTRLDAFTDSQ